MDKAQAEENLKSGIRKHSPVVAELFEREDEIKEYSQVLHQAHPDEVYDQRKKVLLGSIEKYVERLFCKTISLPNMPAVNIVDHHILLNHPILTATNIVANAAHLQDPSSPLIAITSSIVPQDNFFSKGGFIFHGKKVPLFARKDIYQCGCFLPLHDFHFVNKLKDLGRWKEFNQVEQEFLQKIEGEINALDFTRARDYNNQVAVINNFLWKKLFEPKLAKQLPELYYYPDITLVQDCLPEVLKTDNFISSALLEPIFRDEMVKAFDGVTGCWDAQRKKGTHFFWYRTKKNELGRLTLDNGALVSEDGLFTMPMTKDNILQNLNNNVIVPNLLVICSIITFWAGIRPLVGYGSANYITRMKQAWLEVLKNRDQDEYNRLSSIETKGLIGGFVLTFKRDDSGALLSQYAFDVIADGGLTEEYLEKLLAMRFKDLLAPALLEIYDSYVPAEEKVELGLTPADMMGSEFDWIK